MTAFGAEVRRRYLDLIDEFLRSGRTDLAEQVVGLAVAQGVWSDPLQRPVEHVASGSTQPVHPADEFWFVAHLESNFAQIRAEVDAVLAQRGGGFAPVEEPLLDAGRWDQVVLYEGGRRQDEACARFPFIAQVVEQIPEATTFGIGVVTLSWLAPGSRVRPHCGRTNAQLRVHLGIRVPPGPVLRVGGRELRWQEGRCLVFDDSFEHEVHHDGDEPRLILLMDVLNPGLDDADRAFVLAGRRSAADQVATYLAERGIDRVETDDHGVVLRPNAGQSALIRRYMAQTGSSAAQLRTGRLQLEKEGVAVHES
jgi:aspartate beta-hydroxylase